jgi:hypothetical protein
VAPVEVADRLRVERVLDAARQRSGEDDHVGAAREVADLVEQHCELVRVDMRPPLVDLGVRRGGRIDDRGRRTRLVGNADEVVQDRLARQLLDDARAGAAAGKPGRDDGHVEPLQRARNVNTLPARQRQPLARAVALAELEVRHRQRPVDCRVERDGDDHENQLPMWWKVREA